MIKFSSMRLESSSTVIAPDGSIVKELLRLSGGGMAHFELQPGAVSRAISHRTVEEIWFIVSGRGEMWRSRLGHEEVIVLEKDVCLTLPMGTAFQFRASDSENVCAIGVTIPPWPGSDEAVFADGPWIPTTD